MQSTTGIACLDGPPISKYAFITGKFITVLFIIPNENFPKYPIGLLCTCPSSEYLIAVVMGNYNPKQQHAWGSVTDGKKNVILM